MVYLLNFQIFPGAQLYHLDSRHYFLDLFAPLVREGSFLSGELSEKSVKPILKP